MDVQIILLFNLKQAVYYLYLTPYWIGVVDKLVIEATNS